MGSTPVAPGTHDGLIDFSQYTDAQLRDLQHIVDPGTSPLNHANLTSEIARRAVGEQALAVDAANQSLPRWAVRLSPHNGLLGWLEFIRDRQSLYGAGSVEIDDTCITFHGRRRTWLGVPLRATCAISRSTIRNVGIDGTLVQFDQRGLSGWLATIGLGKGRFSFQAESATDAQAIVRALPAARTDGFDDNWAALRRFDRLMAAGGGAWITAALVLVNILVFAVMAWGGQRFTAFDLQSLLSWGGNFGVLTINGQWWRLFTAMFLHLDPAHLLINMWALWNVGRLTERLYGRWLFLGLYMATGMLSGLASVIWDPARVSAGASGAIFGLFGLFLAYLSLRRTHVPRTVFRAHWLSTGVFVVFSLTNGMLQTGIDNAAHVGGLLAGLILGRILAQPLVDTGSARPRPLAMGGAVAVVAIVSIAGVIQARNEGMQLSPWEQYWQSHQDLARDNSTAERRWNQLGTQVSGGSMSVADAAAAFETEMVPAWQKMYDRLRREKPLLPANQARAGSDALDYTENRLNWAKELVAVLKKNDQSKAEDLLGFSKKNDRLSAYMQWQNLRAASAHRPTALSNSTIVTYARTLLRHGGVDCVHGPAAFGRIPTASDAKGDGPALREAAGCAAQQALRKGDYATLEAAFAEGLRTIGEMPDGGSRLQGTVGGLNDLFDYEGLGVDDQFARIANWRRAYPQSVYPDLMEVEVLYTWAWWARGHGGADTVSGQAQAFYSFRLAMAAAALKEIKERANGTPLWYIMSMAIGISEGSELKELRATFDEGHAKFPRYYALHRQMLRALMPRWYGSAKDLTEFFSDMRNQAPEAEREEVFARLAWDYSSMEGEDYDITVENRFGWPWLMTGYQGLMKRYPASDYWLNVYANMACRVESDLEYIKLRPDLDTRLSSVVWSDKISVATCDKKFERPMKRYRQDHPDWRGPAL
ncbi:rhomboid family intramembrane serine protease [Nitrospirillum sp. BR 11163]|uniref:rhomboid family intramembrane serine protease n=1 Tax=Nitrospirillum sp. BR 11163 TaxID=3104323 RepID=UPI002AFE609E|nr:rhomboid family intramembrane serine protease [Nitrospirillum sp. BR 11163]MEA1672281.1 rhomboid family intramembrane serine protease [Nitrospirillum sp. BR 11163]